MCPTGSKNFRRTKAKEDDLYSLNDIFTFIFHIRKIWFFVKMFQIRQLQSVSLHPFTRLFLKTHAALALDY
jgi:hypothetical protein